MHAREGFIYVYKLQHQKLLFDELRQLAVSGKCDGKNHHQP
ncbi:hypothetical protein VINI7043_20936, partial [Vibrio nigripulchritudo ATCC 27043]